MRFPILIIIFFIPLSFDSYSQTPSKQFYEDTEYKEWLDTFQSGDYNKTLSLLEANLKKSSPHPLAANAWYNIISRNKKSDELTQEMKSSLSKNLDHLILIRELYAKDKDNDLIERYPLAQIKVNTDLDFYSYVYLIYASEDISDDRYTYDAAKVLLDRFGENFFSAWRIYVVAKNNQKIFTTLHKEFEEGIFNKHPAVKAFLTKVFEFRPASEYVNLTAVTTFINTYPDDTYANRFKAVTLGGLEKYEQAELSYRKQNSLEIKEDGFKDVAEYLVRQQKYNEAHEEITKGVQTYGYQPDTASRRLAFWASVLVEAGEKGKARGVLEEGIKRFPEHPALNYQFGELEASSSREEYAVPFYRKAWQLQKYNQTYLKEYISALRSIKDYSSVMQLYQQVNTANLREGLFLEFSEAFVSMQAKEEAVALGTRAVEKYPQSAWMLRQLSDLQDQNDEIDGSISSLEQSLQIYKPYSWSCNQYESLLKKKYNDDSEAVESAFRKLLNTYPWSEEVWEKLADEKEDTQAKISVWKEALEINPGRLFPYAAIADIYWSEERWDDCADLLQIAEEEVINGNMEDQVDIHFEKAIYLVGKLRKNQITYQEVQQAISSFNKYHEMGGYDGAYHQYMEEVYEALGDKEKAKQARLNAIKYRPGNYSPYWDLATKDGLINHFYDLWQRDPYHQQNLEDLIRLNAVWGGSNIAAIYLSKLYKEYFPDKASDIDNFQYRAYQKLGMNAKAYEEIYANATLIGQSDRYIDWYHSYRKKSWIGNTTVDLDNEEGMITVTLPDGTIYQQQDDIKYGKIKKAMVGDSYIAFEYNDGGSLTDIVSSSGVQINLSYNGDNKITEMINGDERLTFTYNELGKPVLIGVDNVGVLTVNYDENGEVLSTSAVDEKGEEASSTIAMKITQNMNDLLSNTRVVNNISALSSGQLPNLGFVDEDHETLYNNYMALADEYYIEEKLNRKFLEEYFIITLNLINYNIDNTHVDVSYVAEAYGALIELQNIIMASDDKKLKPYGLKAAESFYRLLQKSRSKGVSMEYWEDWVSTKEWLYLEQQRVSGRDKDYIKGINVFLQKVNEQPVVLMASSEWLPKSWLHTEALWRQYEWSEVVPAEIESITKPKALLYRKNGEIVLGTTHGLLVLRKGFWEWFAYEPFKDKLAKNVNSARLGGLSNINVLHEDLSANLYIGTADGLLILNGDYENGKLSKLNELDGLPGRGVNHIGAVGGKILIGGSKGNVWLNKNGLTNIITAFNGEKIQFINHHEDKMIIGTDQQVLMMYQDENDSLMQEILVQEGRDDGIVIENNNGEKEIFTLKKQEVFEVLWDEESGRHEEVNLFGNIITSDSRQVYGLASVPVNDDEQALGVLTDFGVSLYKNKYFQHFRLPLTVGEVFQARQLKRVSSAMTILTQNGILTFQQITSDYPLDEPVSDLLYVEELGMTFIADGGALKVIKDTDHHILAIGDYYDNTSVLTADRKNRILINNGRTVERYTYNHQAQEFSVEELFYCQQTEPSSGGYVAGDVNQILEAKDGTIWVTAGLAIFRYVEQQDAEPLVQEFNFFRNPEIFPSRTHMISNVVQTMDGRILVVASNEQHLSYRGTNLEGGLLLWSGESEAFVRLNTENYYERGFNWFITSYTPIGENKAVFGTLSGFGEDNFGKLRNYGNHSSELKNSSYETLKDRHPNLFLGTKGVRFGDVWLFGGAAGVVAYYDGLWFYPERLNQLLPDDVEFGNYGSRHVNAISVNKNGEILVGTDRGLLRYISADSDASDLLLRNTDTQTAILYHNVRQLEKESNDVLESLPDNSEAGKLLAEIEVVKGIREKLNYSQAAAHPQQLKPERQSDARKLQNVDSLVNLIENSSARYTELMLKLRQQEPAIWQLLALPPLDLKANVEKLKDDECIVQYIPMSKKLFIHTLTNKGIKIKEVDIERQELMDTVVYVARQMAERGRGTRVTAANNGNEEILGESLKYLFTILLEPIYDDISAYENIIIVPAGELNYLPFATLSYVKDKLRYAVQDHNFGYVSTLYLFDLMNNFQMKCDPNRSVFFADPDETLPGAREEGELLASLTNSDRLFIGENASYRNMLSNLNDANVIHLATHGFLDEKAIEKSWIRLADKDISMANIYDLPLDHTNMMVLSACETALGARGMEYTHLARAFANAGVPSIIASLWAVNDNATKELIVNFYKNLMQKGHKFWALSEAQRQMINSEDENLNRPSRWGGFIPIGKAD